MIRSQLVNVTISNQGKYYKSLGYENVKQRSKFLVPVEHLLKNSNMEVVAECDDCSAEFKRSYQLLNRAERHLCYPCARKDVGAKMDTTNTIKATKSRTGNKHPSFNPNKSEFKEYQRLVGIATNKNDLSLMEHHDKRGRAGVDGAYHLDHIISMKYGFDNNISPNIIGAIQNLRFITWEENYQKRAKSGMPLGALFMLIEMEHIN